MERGGPVDPDVAVAVVDPHLAEPALAVDVAGGERGLSAEPARDRSSISTDGPVPKKSSRGRRGEVHQQPPSENVTRVCSAAWTSAAPALVAGADRDDGVGAVAGADPDRAAGDVDADLDGGGGVERRHDRDLWR